MTSPLHTAPTLKILAGQARPATRIIPEEVPIALVHDGITHAVMMATPTDLEDFALGFAITEGVARPDQIREVEVAEQPDGWEVRLWLAPDAGREVTARRRAILGPTGCGLCGVESLQAAVPPPPRVAEGARFTIAQVMAAMATLKPAQRLNAEAHALHAAGFWTPGHGLVALREDVGRHNALDKLVGALVRSGVDASQGMVLLSSRISVEMVQKAARLGAPALAAASAPTALALRTGEAAGMTLIGVARSDGFEVFTRPDRLDLSGGETRGGYLATG
jgi:FdhD protein